MPSSGVRTRRGFGQARRGSGKLAAAKKRAGKRQSRRAKAAHVPNLVAVERVRRRKIGKQSEVPDVVLDLNDLDDAVCYYMPDLAAECCTPEIDMTVLEDMFFGDSTESPGNDAEDTDANGDPLDEIIGRMVDQLSNDDFMRLTERWKMLRDMSATYHSGKLPVGSGCSGSGMDFHVLTSISRVLQQRIGVWVPWQCSFECEYDKDKRQWLEYFCAPTYLASDVTEIAEDELSPAHLFMYTYGYSCKDFSSLNNVSRDWADTCLTERVGTSGTTWGGNVDYVAKCRPVFLMVENVRASIKGDSFDRMKLDLSQRGYVLMGLLLNTCCYGLPQHRERAYYIALRDDVHRLSEGWVENVHRLMDVFKLDSPLPLSRFLLPDNHPHVEEVIRTHREARCVKFFCLRRLSARTMQTHNVLL